MARAGTPVFSDDSGVRRVTLQLVARAVVGVLVLAGVALAVSLVLGVPLPGLDRLVPGTDQGQEHQATRDAPLTHGATAGPEQSTGGAVRADEPIAKATQPPSAAPASTRKAMTATRTQGGGTTGSNGSVATGANPPSSGSSAGSTSPDTPSATPTPQSDKPRGKPSTKPRNPKAATPARGNSALSNSRAHRPTPSADPSTTAPGKSGASHGKSGTGGSG